MSLSNRTSLHHISVSADCPSLTCGHRCASELCVSVGARSGVQAFNQEICKCVHKKWGEIRLVELRKRRINRLDHPLYCCYNNRCARLWWRAPGTAEVDKTSADYPPLKVKEMGKVQWCGLGELLSAGTDWGRLPLNRQSSKRPFPSQRALERAWLGLSRLYRVGGEPRQDTIV